MDWADIAGSELSSSDDETRNKSKAKIQEESESESEQHVEHAAKADTNELIDAEDKIGTSESSNHNGVVLPSADAMLNSRVNVPSFVNMAFIKQDITVLPKSAAEKNVPRKVLRGIAQISSDTNVSHNASTSQTASSVSQASSILETNKKRKQESEEVLTFQQREKRKRDQGMASRGKNYVEEEKRILRQGGFD